MDEATIYKPHTGRLAWPTLALLGAVLALWLGAWAGALSGLFGLGLGGAMATLAAYLAFTVMHEASHGNIHGARRGLRGLGELAGWAASVTLLAPYPAFRVLHLRHHSHTNYAEKDPDYFVAGSPLAAPLRCLTTIPRYYHELLVGGASRTEAARRARPAVFLGVGAYAATIIALSALGLWREVLLLWVLPAWLASALLAFFFDYLPHHPHRSRERYHDTRVVDSRWLDLPLLGQNLHLVHHLWPRVPFYRYRAAFEDARALLEAKGAEVIDARGRPAPARSTT